MWEFRCLKDDGAYNDIIRLLVRSEQTDNLEDFHRLSTQLVMHTRGMRLAFIRQYCDNTCHGSTTIGVLR
ncbi:hypothetical protein M6B38_106410 [Iris pallida]|uniref:Uncharacterized protein n=1 Tax=Iris pallida TaxID=29817 RepID=A0AAX6ESG4_IRIPA|nr:hypothetical protein M6B38_106410 [Iris pallida]